MTSLSFPSDLVELENVLRDGPPSYNALLGWPWLHTSKAIASTLHQCLKYTDGHGNERMVRGDANPFHGEDVNYADAKFYKFAGFGVHPVPLNLDGETIQEMLRLLICLKGSFVLSIAALMKQRSLNPRNQRCCSNRHLKTKGRLTKRH